jgi:hypothetical protein
LITVKIAATVSLGLHGVILLKPGQTNGVAMPALLNIVQP